MMRKRTKRTNPLGCRDSSESLNRSPYDSSSTLVNKNMHPSRRRTLPDRGILALGDVAAILLFIGAGTVHHGTTDPLGILVTTVPFLVGWFVVAPLAGAYSTPPTRRTEPFYVIGVWVVAALVGLGIRSTNLFDGGAAPSFGFVMVVGGATVFILWRLVLVKLSGRLLG